MKIIKRRPAFEYKLVSDTDDIFGTIFDKTPVSIILLSWPEKRIIRANSAALHLLKVKNLNDIFKLHPKIFLNFTEEIFDKGEFFQTELRIRGRKSTVNLMAKARKFDGNQVIVTFEDITLFRKKEKQLLKLAQRDGLTGLFNHKTLNQRFKEELARAKKYHLPISCFLFDLDDFKMINDKYGHLKGDAVLKKVGQILKGNIRESDIVGRYGGDEFLIIMPETPVADAWIPAKRIHASFQNVLITSKNVEIKSTLSVGISGFPLKGIETVKDIIALADKGLYESKQKGGNHICFAQK